MGEGRAAAARQGAEKVEGGGQEHKVAAALHEPSGVRRARAAGRKEVYAAREGMVKHREEPAVELSRRRRRSGGGRGRGR